MNIFRKEKKVDYSEVLKEKYKAKVNEMEFKFRKENAKKMINEWIENKTISFQDLQNVIKDLNDTPEKVVVKKFVAEFYEELEDATIYYLITQLEGEDYHSELGKWYRNCEGRHKNGTANAQEVIAKMKLYGYEVEKEPLYHVKFPNITNFGFSIFLFKKGNGEIEIADNAGYERMRFTEAEIKAIDERYWPFAVKVSDE